MKNPPQNPNRTENAVSTAKIKHLRRWRSRSRTPRRRRPPPGPSGRRAPPEPPPQRENSSPNRRHGAPGAEQSPRTPAPSQNPEGMSREHLDVVGQSWRKNGPGRGSRLRCTQTFARSGVLRIGKSLIFRGSYIPIPPFRHMWRDQRCVCVLLEMMVFAIPDMNESRCTVLGDWAALRKSVTPLGMVYRLLRFDRIRGYAVLPFETTEKLGRVVWKVSNDRKRKIKEPFCTFTSPILINDVTVRIIHFFGTFRDIFLILFFNFDIVMFYFSEGLFPDVESKRRQKIYVYIFRINQNLTRPKWFLKLFGELQKIIKIHM